jgi:cysteinyl-tRNA synthetase
MFKLYNSRTKETEEVKPLDGKTIRMYTCGPTVYDFAHIGNFRALLSADLLKRYLSYKDFSVNHVMNITDVDDKMIAGSQKQFPDTDPMEALEKFGEKYEAAFFEDYRTLNIVEPDTITRASEYIPEMQKLIVSIIENGFGYVKDGSIYFDVKKYSAKNTYGVLTNIDMEGFKDGARIDADQYEKESAQDFALWKKHKDGEPSWDFEVKGDQLPGRPGWHIECSAMSHDTLEMPFDIHTGGIDLKFPHHEDEIAQNVAGYGEETPINIWFHNGYLQVEGEKMSKSLGNFHTLRDVLGKGHTPEAIRYLLISTHYRQPLNFTEDSLKASKEAINRIQEVLYQSQGKDEDSSSITEQATKDMIQALNDDLNISKALGIMFEAIKEINTKKLFGKQVVDWISDVDRILGLNVETTPWGVSDTSKELQELLDARQKARDSKDFKAADTLRKEIESKFNVEVRDTDTGQETKKKS